MHNYFTNTLDLDDFRRPKETHLALTASSDQFCWQAAEGFKDKPEIYEKFAEAQNALNSSLLSKTRNSVIFLPAHKLKAPEEYGERPIEEIFRLLPGMTHLANFADAIYNGQD